MVQRFCYLLIAIGLGLLFRATVSAQESFYTGKTIRIIVGAPPGGGYDTYSRLIARHIGKHIPGNPYGYCGEHARGRHPYLGQSRI
jgi:tripartite-type tricarboxylate transporter receptor subunit TctC